MNSTTTDFNYKKLRLSVFLVLSILFVDQVSKIWIKTHMFPGEEFRIFDWFYIHFTENNGMAFGFEFGGTAGKMFLSIFRICASFGIGWYLFTLIRKNTHTGLITCFSLILAGAVGNIIDSTFYGMMFSNDISGIAQIFPENGGYAPFLHGRVVDMLYFPLFTTQLPSWIPFIGGESFQFFRPIFNIADSSITIGVILFIIFQKKFTHAHHSDKKTEEQETASQSL